MNETTSCQALSPAAEARNLSLKDQAQRSLILTDYARVPDATGTLINYAFELPAYRRAAYYCGTWWPYGGNRAYGEVLSATSHEGGIFSILELEDGDYLAILPLCGTQAWAWFAPLDGELRLRLGTRGTERVMGDIPVVAWARANSPYEAANKVWKQATQIEQLKGWMKMREEKPYPDMFRYLGWCSWEEFKKNISADSLAEMLDTLEANELPFRYLLVDDGHFSLESLMPKPSTFPKGYRPLTELRNEDGVKWIGMWHALLGGQSALAAENPPAIADAMMTLPNGKSVPKPDAESIKTFMEYMVSQSKEDGIDFLKVDFCGTLLSYYAGTKSGDTVTKFPDTNVKAIPNPSAATALYARIYQHIVKEQFDGLLNCNWHVPHFIFNSGDSAVGRCGPDYKLTVKRARECIYMSFSSIPWLGQIAWGDHDMFHSSDPLAARMMAISKALSGGPTYLSDNPAKLLPNEVWPLCYKNGRLLRTLAPGAPVPEDLFMNLEDERPLRTMAPLANGSVAFACYNLYGNGKTAEPVMTTHITTEDYRAASGMIQPYPGPWSIPAEGLLVYDHQTQTAQPMLADTVEIQLAGFGVKLIQLSPIQHGWSVIGRTDKYLSAAAVEVLNVTPETLKLNLHEAAPFTIWLEHGVPVAEGVTFSEKGNGMFCGTPALTEDKLSILISVQ